MSSYPGRNVPKFCFGAPPGAVFDPARHRLPPVPRAIPYDGERCASGVPSVKSGVQVHPESDTTQTENTELSSEKPAPVHVGLNHEQIQGLSRKE